MTSLLCGWLAPKYVRARREASALEALADLRPRALFDFQFDADSETYDYEKQEPPGSKIAKWLLGENYDCYVESLSITCYEDDLEVVKRIADFHQLKQLTIIGDLKDLSPLENLHGLEDLTLTECYNLQPNDLLALENLKRLKKLNVKYLPDFNDLAKLTQLEELRLTHCSATNFKGISNFENLRSLHVNSSKNLTDLSPIGNLAKLEVLELSMNGFESYEAIGNLPRLKKLQLAHPYAGFEEWGWLAEAQWLEELDLSSSRINKLPSLKKLQNLSNVDVTYCSRLTSSAPLVDLKNLTELSVGHGTPLQILDEIEKLPKLRKLYIGRTKKLTDAEREDFKRRVPKVKISP